MSDLHIDFARPIYARHIFLPLLRWPRPGKRPATLDLKSLPDHLKRDMGILDGNDPTGRRG
jgi:hypothetical protein